MNAPISHKQISAQDTGLIAPVLADSHDRITDAYYGKMGPEFMRKTQERIHWVCGSVQGSRVLDVGCSQGIVPILLGREGKTVVGVDSDEQAVKQADAHLASEPSHVQAQVRFLQGNFLKQKLNGEHFDTIVMTEVLEHVLKPEDFVTAAADLLAEGGCLVVTVPFGINDFIDHKRTYYLCDIYALLASRFDIGEVRVFGHWIGLVGKKLAQPSCDASAVSFTRDLLEKTEAGFYQIERELRTQWATAKQKLDDANAKYRAATEQIAALQKKLSEEERLSRQTGAETAQFEARLSSLSADVRQQTTIARAAEKDLVRVQTVADGLRSQLEDTTRKHQAAAEQILTLKHNVAGEKAEREVLARQFAQARQQFELELARLRDQIQSQTEKKHAIELQCVRAETTLENVRSQFKTASQKYNGAADQVATLKQKIAEEKPAMTLVAQLRGELQDAGTSLKREQASTAALLAKAQTEHAQELAKLERKLKCALETRATAEAQIAKTRATLSFQLGYLLLHGFKSWDKFKRLPGQLLTLRQEAKRRKQQNRSKLVPSAPLPSPPAVMAEHTLKVHESPTEKNGKPQGNGQKTKFISILDEISDASWRENFVLYPVNRKNYKEQIEKSTSAALFLESCWKGNQGHWEYAFTSPGLKHANAQALCDAIDVAKNRKLPIIFWNKEDPMHYDRFMPIAFRCDIIFTTDSNKVADYKRDVPNAKIFALAFAANPKICNPSGRFRQEQDTICFAGSYYSEGHEDRKEQMDKLLPTIIEFNGQIYDRMSKLNNDRYAYPSQYKPYIKEAVPFTEIVNTYKKFKLFLNVNTITDSPTMMSRRVYELLACGTPVISTPSLAIEEQFKGIVQVAKDAKEANEIARRLLSNEWEWLRLSHRGYREIMSKHTYTHRAEQIKSSLGVGSSQSLPLISIITASNRPHFIERITDNVLRQDYPNLELAIVIQGYTEAQEKKLGDILQKNGAKLKKLTIIRDDSDATLGSRLNKAAKETAGEYLAKMDDDDFYFEKYLSDMIIPFSFGDYGLVGKKEVFVYLEGPNKTYVRFKEERHKETDFVAGATILIKRDVFQKTGFADANRGEDSNLIKSVRSLGFKVYASDPFNFIVFRSASHENHTWQVEDSFFSSKGHFIGDGIQTAQACL